MHYVTVVPLAVINWTAWFSRRNIAFVGCASALLSADDAVQDTGHLIRADGRKITVYLFLTTGDSSKVCRFEWSMANLSQMTHCWPECLFSVTLRTGEWRVQFPAKTVPTACEIQIIIGLSKCNLSKDMCCKNDSFCTLSLITYSE